MCVHNYCCGHLHTAIMVPKSSNRFLQNFKLEFSGAKSWSNSSIGQFDSTVSKLSPFQMFKEQYVFSAKLYLKNNQTKQKLVKRDIFSFFIVIKWQPIKEL